MADSLFKPLNIDVQLPETPAGGQGSLFGLAAQKGFDLEQAVARNQRNVEKSLVGKLGLDPNGVLGQYTNLLASTASGGARVAGNLATLGLDTVGVMAQASVPEEQIQAYNRTIRGDATPEDAALLNQTAPGDDGIPQTYFQRLEGTKGIQQASQKVADFFDISSIVDTTRRDRLSDDLKESTADGVAQLRDAYAAYQRGDYGDAAAEGAGGLFRTIGSALATGVTDPGAVAEYAAENVPQIAAHVINPALGLATNLGYGADIQRDAMATYFENNNGQFPDSDERRQIGVSAALAAGAEQIGDIGLLRGMRVAGTGLVSGGARIAGGVAREGATEGFQTVQENNAKFEDTSLEEIVEAATIGGLVGGTFQGGAEISNAISRNATGRQDPAPDSSVEDLTAAALDSGDVSNLVSEYPDRAVSVLAQLSEGAEPDVVQANLAKADEIEQGIQDRIEDLQANMENNSAEAIQEFRDILDTLTPDDADYVPVQQALEEAESYTPEMRKQDEATVAQLQSQLASVRQAGERMRVDTTPDVDQLVADVSAGDVEAGNRALTLTMQNPDAIDPSVAAEMSRNEALPMEQRDALAKFAVAQEASNALKDRAAVNTDVLEGGAGFKGLNQYRSAMRSAVQSNDFDKASTELQQLESFAATRESKANAIANAYEQVKGTNSRVFIAPDAQGNWVTTPTKQANGLAIGATGFRLRDDVRAEATALRTGLEALQSAVTAAQARNVASVNTAEEVATAPVEGTTQAVTPAPTASTTTEPVAETTNLAPAEPVMTGELTALRNRTGAPITSDNYQKVNLLGESFTQEAGRDTDASVRPLAATPNFMSKVRSGEVSLKEFIGQEAELSPNQRTAVNRFFGFQKNFDKFVQQGFTRRRDPAFRFQDYSQFLINDDGTVDENARTAISVGAFTWTAENVNSLVNSQEGINMILGREAEEEISSAAYAVLGRVGTREDVVANQLGARIAQALGIRARPDAAANEQARLESALGIQAIGAMVRAGMMKRTEISDATLQRLRNSTDPATKAVHTFVNLTHEDVDGRPRANATAQAIREGVTGSQSVLNKLFSTEASGIEPSYEPVPFDQTFAKRTGQLVPKVLADTLEKEGAKAHRVRQDMYQVWGNLSAQALYRIAGVVNDKALHIENIASQQAKNEGLMAQVDNLTNFINKMVADPTTEGLEQPLYFGRSVWKPQRVGLNTNVINPQTSKVHRHMLAMDNWETEVDTNDVQQMNNFKLRVMEAFGKKTEAKATQLVLADYDALVNDPVIQGGVNALATILRGESDMSVNQEQSITDAVDAAGENFHSLDALVALAHQKNAVDGKFKTTFMGEVDGLTNGPMLSLLMLGAKDMSVMNQGGFFSQTDAYTQFNDFKGDGNLDLYESTVKGALARLDVKDSARLDALQVITGQLLTDEGNVTSKGRNVIKKPFTAMMFGSNTATAVLDMAQGFVDSIYSKMEDVAEKGDEAGMTSIINAANTLIGNKNLMLDPRMGIAVAMETKLTPKQQEMIRGSFFELLGQHVQSSLEDNYGVFLERRNVVNQSAQLAFRLYNAAYEALVKKAEETSPSIARRTTRTGQSQALRTLTEAELRTIRNQLKDMEPILLTAMAKKSGNQLDAGMHMSKTRRELDPSLPFSSEVYFGEEVETFDEQGRATRRKTTSVNGMRTLATDPGVAPFITSIHSTDSAIASQVYGEMNALNVHDALGVGLHSVEEVGQKLNQATYENMRDYSAASEMVNTLERVVTGLNQLMTDPDTAALIQPELKKISAELTQRKLGTIEEHLDRARNVAVAADTAKLEMLVGMKAVGQYATEGGSYMVTDQDRASAQAALDAVGSEFNQDAVAAAANLDSVTAAEPLLRKAGTSQQLSNNSVQTLTPATSLNTLERIDSPEAEAVRDALLNNVTLEAAKEVLDAPQAAELVQQVADNTRPRMSVWGELGQPVIQSNQVLVDLMQTTQLTARQLVESLEALNTDAFTARLLGLIKRTVPADMPVNYITSETGPEGAMGTGVSKARGWYHQEGGFQAIYVKSPEFVESGITPEMLTHELVHAALGQIVEANTGKATEAGKAVADLENLRVAAAQFISNNTELASKFRNATGNVHEMLAWGLTNQDFQQDVLAKIPAQTKAKGLLNGLTDFINTLTRLIFRGNATAADRTGLGQLVAQSAGLFREAANLRAKRNQQTMLYEDAVDHVNAMTSEEVLTALEGASPNVVSTQHQQRLMELVRDFVEPIYGPYGAFKEEASANRAITPMDVYMKSLASGKKPFASRATTGPFAMTQQEGYALESIQAVLEETLRNPKTVFLRQALTNLFNEAARLPAQAFHNGDWSTASQQEKDLAQEKKDFIFKLSPGVVNKSGYLAQFAALTLASEEVRAVMDFTTAGLPTPPKSAPIGTRLIALFRKAMAQLASLVTKTSAGEQAVDSIRTLVGELVDIEAKRKARLMEDRLNALDQVEIALANVGNSLRERAEALGGMPFFTQSSKGYIRGAGAVIRTVSGQRVEDVLDHISNIRDRRFAGKKHGITQGFIEEMRGVYDGNRVAAELFKGAKAIEKDRKDTIENTVASVMASFKEGGQYLTQQDKNSITRVLLRTNASALASAYGLARTQEMFEKPDVLRTERNKLEQQLKGMTQHWGYMSAAAKDLAYHKVIGGNVSHNLMLNTGNIARLLGTKVANTLSKVDEKAITELLDKLMPMYAIQYSNDLDMKRAVQVMRTEANRQDGNGIDMVLKLHAGLQQHSANMLFKGQETLQQSGYVPEIHDNKIEVLLVDRKKLESMEKAGYKQATELQKDKTDGANDDRVMVTRRGAGPTALLTGSLSFTGMHRKGSSADRETVNLLQGTNTTSQQHVALIKKNKADLVANLFSRGLSYDPRKVQAGVMVPVMHPNGTIVDYRYTMTEHNRDVLLDRDNSMEQVLGTMAGQIVDKVDTQQQNADVVRAMHDQYRAEYRSNPNKFVNFGKSSSDPDLAELYRLLPESTKREIRRVWKSDDMLIPANQLNLIVGYRKYSLTSTFDKAERNLTQRALPGERNWAEQLFVQVARAFLGEKAALRVGQAEDLLQELVKEAKDILVVKNITTLVGNMMSNISLLAVEGVPIRQMIESHAVAIKGATDYRKDAKRVMQIRQLLDIGYVVDGRDKLEQELVQAQDRMARNPIKPLIDAGLMPTIVEDVEADDSQYSYKSRLQRGVEKYTARVPKLLKEVGKQVYMTHDTSTYKFLSQTTQLSDLVARYALYQHLTTRQRDPLSSADALAQAEEAFVNYDLPSHRSIQFMNDTGLVMFTKYYMRIQKVIARLIRQKPARVLGLLAAEHYFSGIQSVMDSTWFNRINNPFGFAGLEYPSTLGELPTFKLLN